jgi:signal transduction histidine kinase/ligand-binding sensor domain-containing protein/DNA-binding response OmpR family regulator
MHRIIFALIIIGLALNAFSQRNLDFESLAMEDGFSSSKANVILQDKKGFIWIGTWNGLNRYDGYQSEIFRPNYHDSTTLSNREVVDLIEDHNGNIWVGTSSGLNCLNPETLEIEQYEFENRIISLYEDKNHFIWVGTWNGGLYRLDPQTGQKDHFLVNEIISDIHEDTHNNLWVATYYGLINFDRNNGSFIRYLPSASKNSISHSTVTNIAESSNGDLWIGTWGGGLNKLSVHPNKDSLRFTHYMAKSVEGSLTDNVVYRLYFDQFDNLWIGTWNDGLSLLEPEQQNQKPGEAIFHTHKSDLSDPFSLSGNNITALHVDRSGILWVGSSKIDRANIKNTGVIRYKTNRIIDGINIESAVRAFDEQDDKLWVGTYPGLKLYEKNNERFRFVKNIDNISYSHNGYDYTATSIMSIANTNQGLWVGTEDAGLILFTGDPNDYGSHNNFYYLNYSTSPAIPGEKITNIVQSRKNPDVLWCGTMQSGFFKLTYNNGKAEVETYPVGKSKEAYSDYNIRDIHEDSEGYVWIGTQNGLNRFDPETKTFQKYFYSAHDITSLNDNVINVIHESENGDLWIGTNAGLNKKQQRLDHNGSVEILFKGFPKVEHIGNEIILSILEDDSTQLWLGFFKGVAQFNAEKETIVKEYFTNEFQNVNIHRGASLKTTNGIFIFGGTFGFLSFKPESLFKTSMPPEVSLTDIHIFNESIGMKNGKKRYGLKKSVPYTSSLNLSHNDNVVSFAFSALNFKNPKKNTYAYYLEGFDKQWNNVGTRNTAIYTSIPHGDYTFWVKAANSDGVWSEETALLKLTITPPWWKTWWAYIIYIILFFGLLYFFKEYSIIDVKEKSRIKLENLHSEERQRLNELKAQFFTDITHELRTPLTLILGPAKELATEKNLTETATKQVSLIQRNAHKLMRLVNQLMEFRKIEKEKMDVYIQQCNLSQLIEGIYESFKQMAESRNIEFKTLYPHEEIVAYIDPNKFEKIIYNLVLNAFKYSDDNSQISIKAALESNDSGNEMLVVEIEDTGIGISEEHQQKIFERFFQVHHKRTQNTGGIGLYISKSLTEQHGGTITVDSELGKGSCFRVCIPVKSTLGETDENEGSTSDVTAPNNIASSEQLTVSNETNPKLPSVLIVEDDLDLNEFLVTGLSCNFKVYATYNGKEALELAQKVNPDIIVTDIMMPVMDGFELCKTARKDLSTSHIPVVFLTAKTMHEDEIEGLKMGAVDYVYKPFSLESLKLKIQNILDNRQQIHKRIYSEQILEPEKIELTSLDEKFLNDAVEAVNKNLDNSTFDVEKFSHEIGISPNQAYRKIKALTGQTAKEFIRNQRLKVAASLLKQKKRSISEVIYMVGFSSPSYFTRCFKDYYGCTPKEYIDKN